MKFASSHLFFISAVIAIMTLACAKKPSSGGGKTFDYVSLKSDKDTIKQGNVTNVKVNFTGSASIKWSCNAGDLFGTGNNILFGASTCCVGNHSVTCTLSDNNNNSESKTIIIFVIAK